MSKVYIVAAKRSAIGSFLGTLSQITPAEFGTQVLKETLLQGKVKPEMVDEVIVGNVLPAGQKQGLPRQISIAAGISSSVPAYTVNMICGSGMKAVINAYVNIKAGQGDVIVAGGVESMSQAPYLVNSNIRSGVKMGSFNLIDYMIEDGLTDAFNNYHMGITAENIVDQYQLTREEQDDFAYLSQVKAAKADDAGLFKAEIAPILIKTRKGDIIFEKDEYINRTTSREKIATLRPAFKKDGSVTAGSSSGINDGASFVVVASEAAIKKYNLTPLVEIIGIGQAGVDPKVMGLGPIPAIRNVLKNANLKLTDIDTIELNEAFAAQSLGVIKGLAKEHGISEKAILDKTNPNGGAIALGHPVGASGNRIIVTLIYNMLRNKDDKLGLASLCIGGGMGTAIILKKG